MTLSCPYCAHAIALKDPAPGKFTTHCPKCSKKFLVGIPKDPARAAVVSALKSERDGSETLVQEVEETIVPPASVASKTEPEPDPGATIDWDSMPKPADEPAATGTWKSSPTDDSAATADWGSAPSAERTAATIAATPSSASPPRAALASGNFDGKTLGGYRLVKELGRGGMGSVYLARQVSLDRDVALKVMSPRFADDPKFVARFTREAYAAAQLVHHNVVQIYDFGEDHGTSYFSMEFVDGENLSSVVKKKTRLDPEEAVGYVLQAARGLKFAHDQSLIHRDIKPDNLMINSQGIVKVADLGLVKTVGGEEPTEPEPPNAPRRQALDSTANITRADVAMGTPAYMAPEQIRDAAGVDHRADIYSLGCTLYDLVTGKPPFEGRTAFEVMTKHQTEAIVPPERIAKRVPKVLSDIILKMTAKKAEDRHPDLGAVIDDLEGFLGIRSSGPFTPKEEHANLLEESVATWAAVPQAKLRAPALLGVLGGGLLLTVVFALMGRGWLAAGFLGLGVMTILSYFAIDGIGRKTHLFDKAREWVLGGTIGDWAMAAAGGLLTVALLWAFGMLVPWLAFTVLAVGIAFGLYFGLSRKAELARDEPLAKVEEMLRSMRLLGLEEDNLRQFVCKYAGTDWEGFYESLFGYEDKLAARDRWGKGDRGRARAKFGAWREPIVAWLDGKLAARKEARDAKALQKIEEKNLEAQGENLVTARRKAQRSADAMVATAAAGKKVDRRDAQAAKALAKAMRDAASKPETVLLVSERGLIRGRSGSLVDRVIGPRVRFLAGALLVGTFVMWMNQNGMLTRDNLDRIKDAGANLKETVVATQDISAVKDAAGVKLSGSRQPLAIPMVPGPISGLLGGFAAGVAGLVLLMSSFRSGRLAAALAIPGAVIALIGPKLGMPDLGPLSSANASMAVAAALGLAGVVIGRRR